MERESISIRNARANNLRSVCVDIPTGKLVVITGPSGSGKSSLAVNTIFAEGQRQYIESLSTYARQFFNQLPRAEVDEVIGLPPTLCIQQRYSNLNPRSTVGTQTEIHDHFRLLFARIGEVRCHQCGCKIAQQSIENIRQQVMSLGEQTKLMVLAPMVRGESGLHSETLDRIRKERLIRVRVDGEIHDIDQLPELHEDQEHTIEAVTDRIIIRDDIESRLMEALQLSERLADGLINVVYAKKNEAGESEWKEVLFCTHHRCLNCSTLYSEIEPRTFSFNSPYGMCPDCQGSGGHERFDIGQLVPDRSLSIRQGAVLPWQSLTEKKQKEVFQPIELLLRELGSNLETRLDELSDSNWNVLVHGTEQVSFGILNLLEKEYATNRNPDRLEYLESFRGEVACASCQGTRLGVAANSVFINGKTIADWSRMSIQQLLEWLPKIEADESKKQIAEPIVEEILKRLQYLEKVGLSYLTLDRSSRSLSGGEFQRIRLASAIGTGLTGVCYILDEPSIGLHARDVHRLLETIRELQRSGNSVIVVEHDEEIIRAADWLIDVGPRSGKNGGEIEAAGAPNDLISNPQSSTTRWLSGMESLDGFNVNGNWEKSIRLKGAKGNNLRNLDVEFPLERLVAITGVSGSGKSTLVRKTLFPAMASKLGLTHSTPAPFDTIEGTESIEKLIWVDQHPIGKTGRGCLATYSGILNEIRKIFAATKLSKQRGYPASRFSFNSDSGRCSQCQGLGQSKIEMNFLPDVYVPCSECGGMRYNRETLRVDFKGRSIGDVLAMEVSEALEYFDSVEKIRTTLECFADIGLGYLTLGQPSNTLSGGEAQRLKLATELSRPANEKTLYLLDEPTTGLHFGEVEKLVKSLRRLVELGHSVIVIEHHLDVISHCDWIIDLGPEGGEQGGQLVAAGGLDTILTCQQSETGRAIRHMRSKQNSNG